MIVAETHCLPSPWPHRLTVLLACATFPLIWVGGLVTTYDAGMAVPDWPTTFGYNLFLYPWQTWLFGPWDLLIEHGHRLLGATVGMLTIALVVSLWAYDGRRWMRWLGVAALAGVVFQGVLGGLRVRLDERLLAQIHGCVGPGFFALTSVLAVLTSRRWFDVGWDKLALASAGPPGKSVVGVGEPMLARPNLHLPAGARLPRIAAGTAALAYLQIVLGSQLRHVQVTADATVFRLAVWFHLIVAAALAVHICLVWVRGWREAADNTWLRRPANLLVALLGMQLALGCGAWVVNYGWPAWLHNYAWAAGYVVERESFLQAMVTTGHVATGSLIMAFSVILALRAGRAASARSQQQLAASSLSLPLSLSPSRVPLRISP